eukprot:2776034-Pleurochrysis_carterae.AAC.1
MSGPCRVWASSIETFARRHSRKVGLARCCLRLPGRAQPAAGDARVLRRRHLAAAQGERPALRGPPALLRRMRRHRAAAAPQVRAAPRASRLARSHCLFKRRRRLERACADVRA